MRLLRWIRRRKHLRLLLAVMREVERMPAEELERQYREVAAARRDCGRDEDAP